MSKRQRRCAEKRRRHQADRQGHLRRSLATGAGVTVGATLLMGGAAQAACTCTVDSLLDTADPGHTTLRDAITSANQLGNEYSTITFASGLSGDTITLNGTELPHITNSTTIQGPTGGISIDGDYNSRILYASATQVTISGVTIQHGTADNGAGIFLQAGNLTVQDSTLTGNIADTGNGGGIYVHTGNLTVDSSTISDNESHDFGGGISENATSISNHAGNTTIRNSTLSGNSTVNYGGAVYFNYQSQATVQNTTVYGNYSGGVGGGFYHFGQGAGPGLVITGSTITLNYANDRGGGVGSAGTSGFSQPTIRDSIVSDNETTAGPGSDISADTGTMDVGFSLIGSRDPNTTLNPLGPNLIGTDPQLTSLADFGGPTQTQKPATTSPVVDAGSAFGLTTDQRGQTRPFDAVTSNAVDGDAADIGAVELQVSDLPAAPTTTPTTPTTIPSTPVSKKRKCKKKKHKRSAESAKKKKCKKKKKTKG
jgi:hypothetical protein